MSLSEELSQFAERVLALEREVSRLRVENKSLRVAIASLESEEVDEPWVVLGLDREASEHEIGRAFRELSRQFHPDNRSTGDAEAFQAVVDARAAMLQRLRRR